MLARYRIHKLCPVLVVALTFASTGGIACSGNDDGADVVVLSLEPTAVGDSEQTDDTEPQFDPGRVDLSAERDNDDLAGGTDTSAESANAKGDSFVTEAVAGANAAEERHLPTPTPTLLPRRGAPTANATPDAPAPGPTSQPTTGRTPSQPTTGPTTIIDGNGPRPSACSDGFSRVYEAFATNSPSIGIAICVAPDGRAEYLGLDVDTNARIRLSACVDGANFVANNAGSLYVIDIASDTIRYPQAPDGRHLDTVTMITSAATIPALGC